MENTTKKYNAIVNRVVDGDTVHLDVYDVFLETKLTQDITVRMVGIDAPETKGKEKPLGVITKEWLKKRIEGKEVTVVLQGKDYYKRWLGVVYDGETNINELLVKEHLVERYSPEKHDDGILEIEE